VILPDLRERLAQCHKSMAAAPIFVRPYLAPLAELLDAIVAHLERVSDDSPNR
jgi:hypothetical protein